MPTCNTCKLDKGSDQFYGCHKTICKECKKKYTKSRRTQTEGIFLRNLFTQCRMRHTRGGFRGDFIDWEAFRTCYYAQEGKCALTGFSFDLTNSSCAPSPDRINNGAGYVLGNIQFVMWQVNNMRGSLSIPKFVHYCSVIAIHSMKHAVPRVALSPLMPSWTCRIEGKAPYDPPKS